MSAAAENPKSQVAHILQLAQKPDPVTREHAAQDERSYSEGQVDPARGPAEVIDGPDPEGEGQHGRQEDEEDVELEEEEEEVF